MRNENTGINAMIRNALFSLIFGSLVGSLATSLLSGFMHKSLSYVLPDMMWLASAGILVALPVVFIFGVPLYALLSKYHLNNYLTSVIAGCIPGLFLAIQNDPMSIAFLVHGTCIAISYHWLMITRKPAHSNEAIST